VSLFCIFISACTQASVTSSSEALEPINTIAPILTPADTKAPTPDFIQYYCPDITPTSDLQDVGIVYRNTLDDKTYLLDTVTDQRTVISEEGFTSWGYAMISQDHRYIAYFAESDTEWLDLLKVVDAKGTLINKFIRRGDGWWKLIRWQGHELMLNYPPPDYGPYRILIMDPFTFTGQLTRIVPDYEDIIVSQHGVSGWGVSAQNASVYDGSLKYVVYYTNNQNVVLYDIEKQKVLWEVHDIYPYTSPVWSPDDQHLVIEVNQSEIPDRCEITVLNKSGLVESTTHFTSVYQNVTILETAWSENGEYVSFLINTQTDDPQVELGILDVSTGQVSIYCVQTDYDHRSSAVWLADNERLIVNGVDEKGVETSYLIDLKTNEISIFGMNMVTFGWVVQN
jgi:hypothetical protein